MYGSLRVNDLNPYQPHDVYVDRKSQTSMMVPAPNFNPIHMLEEDVPELSTMANLIEYLHNSVSAQFLALLSLALFASMFDFWVYEKMQHP